MTSDPAELTASPARRAIAVAVLVALAVLVAGWTIRPATPELDPAETGDPSLRALVDSRHDGAGHRLAVAVVDLGDAGTPVRFAGYGADQHSVFEIGSVTKGLTGLLLAEAVDRGEPCGWWACC